MSHCSQDAGACRRRLRPTTRPADDGFTLVELVTVMALMSILGAIGVTGLVSVQRNQEVRGTQRELVSALRNAQTRAVAENTTWCVDFGTSPSKSAALYRVPGIASGTLPAGFACSTSGTAFGTVKAQGDARYRTPAFEQRDGSSTSYALFYPRGAASPGSVKVGRAGTDAYTLTLDGLTGRVASTGQ